MHGAGDGTTQPREKFHWLGERHDSERHSAIGALHDKRFFALLGMARKGAVDETEPVLLGHDRASNTPRPRWGCLQAVHR